MARQTYQGHEHEDGRLSLATLAKIDLDVKVTLAS